MNWIKDLSRIGAKEARVFGLAWSIVFCVMAVSKYIKGDFNGRVICAALAAGLFMTALVRPLLLKPVYFLMKSLWHGFVTLLTAAALALLFYLVITPIGMFMRICGKDILDKRIDKTCGSYWQDRAVKRAGKEELSRQF